MPTPFLKKLLDLFTWTADVQGPPLKLWAMNVKTPSMDARRSEGPEPSTCPGTDPLRGILLRQTNAKPKVWPWSITPPKGHIFKFREVSRTLSPPKRQKSRLDLCQRPVYDSRNVEKRITSSPAGSRCRWRRRRLLLIEDFNKNPRLAKSWVFCLTCAR